MNHRIYWAAALGLLLAALPARSTNIFVTSTEQKVTGVGGCSLQEAIYSANFDNNIAVASYKADGSPNYITTQCVAGSGADVIVLPSGTPAPVFAMFNIVDDIDNFIGPAANPMITSSITMEAGGAQLLGPGISSSRKVRLFVVIGTGHLTLRNAYVRGFVAKGGDGGSGGGGGMGAGGAIYVEGGGLTVEASTFDGNAAIGGNGSSILDPHRNGVSGGGGGLSGNGGASLDNGFDQLGADSGGGARGNGVRGGGGPAAGSGGGGTLRNGSIGGSTDVNIGGAGGLNCGGKGGDAGNGDAGDAPCPGGGGGGGGSDIVALFGGGGKGGNGNYGGGGGGGGGMGDGGRGGFGGGGGAGDQGGDAGFGGGGGASAGISLVSENPTSGGSAGRFGGRGGNPSGGGGAALGGAIFSHSGTLVIQNSTFANNSVLRGSAGTNARDQIFADNGQDAGGAIFAVNGSLTVQNSTISGNQGTGSGAGIVVVEDGAATSFTLNNTIVFGNGAQECFVRGTVAMNGVANLIDGNGNGGQFVPCPGALTGADPQLGPLELNFPGSTPTMAIPQTSPAWNTADASTSLATDQRGEPRPSLGGFDIGAFELCLQRFGPIIQVCPFPPVIAQTELLTIGVTGSGTTNPAPGAYSDLQDTVVALKATPDIGNAFLNWTGNVADPLSASTTVIMNMPQTVTANFTSGTVILGGNILTKSGPLNARVWPINIANASTSAATAFEVELNTLTLTQVAGAACTPALLTPLPVSPGALPPGFSATVQVTVDFTGCASTARFTAQATFSADGGGITGSMTRTNQFP